MEEEHQELDKPSYGALRNLKITQSREEANSVNQQRELSFHYSLRKNPKKKTLKSPESMKKILFRCEECGKGFRYEKCLLNHQEVMHLSTNQSVFEESLKSLCSSFSLIKKKKRTKIIRSKKTSLSCSFTTFLESPSVFAADGEELEVAECLILLSKSSPKFVEELKLAEPKGSYDSGCLRNKKLRKAGEFESGFFSNKKELMDERISRYENSKETASFLGDDHKLDQRKRRKAGEFEFGFLSNEQRLLKEEITTHETFEESLSFLGRKCELDKQKLRKGVELGTGLWSNGQKLVEETWKESAIFLGEKHELDQQKPRKAGDYESAVYSTELEVGAMECSDSDAGSDKGNAEHQCRLCNKIFSSYQALGGHQTFHRMSKSKNKKNCREESVEPEDESVRCSVKQEKKKHKCSICSRKFRSVHALDGHKKCHGKRQHSKTEADEDLGGLSVVPITVGNEFY